MQEVLLDSLFNPIALRKAKIVHNFGTSECNRANYPDKDTPANSVAPESQTAPEEETDQGLYCLLLTHFILNELFSSAIYILEESIFNLRGVRLC